MSAGVGLFAVVGISGVFALLGLAMAINFNRASEKGATWVDQRLQRWPDLIQADRGAYGQTAIRWWGVGLLGLGLVLPLGLLAYSIDNGRAGGAHILMFIPLAAAFGAIVGPTFLSNAYRQTRLPSQGFGPKFIATAVSALTIITFAIVVTVTSYLGFV